VTYLEYKARFFRTVPFLSFPKDCIVGLPTFVTSPPNNVWQFQWVLEFLSDNHYVRCRESWSYRFGEPARRHLFSFHYGPICWRKADGAITYRETDSVVLRCDKKNHEPEHLHHQAQLPHYTQDRVRGIVIDEIDMYVFVRAVLQARQSGQPVDAVLGYTVL
jgi:hypothetical protein